MKTISVIGLGAFGTALVRSLHAEGARVIAVDYEMERIEAVRAYTAEAVCFDVMDADQLRMHGITDCDVAVIAIGEAFEPVVMVAMELINAGVPKVLARAFTDTQEQILRRIGVTEVIYPEQQFGTRLGITLMREGMRDLAELGDGLSIFEIDLPPALSGYPLRDLQFRTRYGLNVLTIRRNQADSTRTIGVPMAETIVLKGDKLVVMGKKADCDAFIATH